MHKLTATVHALFPVDAKRPLFQDTPVFKALSALGEDETAKALLVKAEAEFLVKHGENMAVQVRVACAALLALLPQDSISETAREAEKSAFAAQGKVALSMVEIRKEIVATFTEKRTMSKALRAVYTFAKQVDEGGLKELADQKKEGEKLGLTEDARKVAWVVGQGEGWKYEKDGKSFTMLSLLYLVDGKTEDGNEIPAPAPAPAPAPKGKGK